MHEGVVDLRGGNGPGDGTGNGGDGPKDGTGNGNGPKGDGEGTGPNPDCPSFIDADGDGMCDNCDNGGAQALSRRQRGGDREGGRGRNGAGGYDHKQ